MAIAVFIVTTRYYIWAAHQPFMMQHNPRLSTSTTWQTWQILLICLTMATAQTPLKRYFPTEDGPYWFETQSDLSFTEELTLPGYDALALGRLEYPSIAAGDDGTIYVAYNYTDTTGAEGVYLATFQDAEGNYQEVLDDSTKRRYLEFIKPPQWQSPRQVSSILGIEYRPRVAVGKNGVAWVVWSGRREGTWHIYARQYDSRLGLGPEVRLSAAPGNHFRPVVLATRSSDIWVAWETSAGPQQMSIVARRLTGGSWSQTMSIESRPGYAYRPAMTEAENGTVWFGWDHTTGHNSDIYLRPYRRGALGKALRVSTHPAIDSKVDLTWNDGKLWVAWSTNRRGRDDWGIIRYPVVRAWDGKRWHEPVAEMPGIDLVSRSENQSFEYPTLTFDPYGRLYLFTRHDHEFSAAYYDDGRWSDIWLVDEIGWAQRGLYVHTSWISDTEMWMARRDRRSIFLQKMVRRNPTPAKVRLKRYDPEKYPLALRRVAGESYRGAGGEGSYDVYFGDLHVHTAYSDGSGSFDELYNLYRNVYKVDFLAITEHDELGSGTYAHLSPGEWAYLKALNEIYNEPGKFVTINGYEWTHSTWAGRQDSTVVTGHKNVYFRGGEESPFFSHFGEEANTATALFNTLRQHDAIAFPHHPAWGGLTWHNHDPEIQTNYEIVSIHGANEYMGNLPIPHRGGAPGTYAQDGFAQGKIIGLVGASDSHGLYHHSHEGWRDDPYKGGLTGVLLDSSLTREAVWDALKARRNYATAGEKHYLNFSIDGHPMGTVFTATSPPTVSFIARSYDILYAYIIRNNKEWLVSGMVGGPNIRYRGVVDETIQPGLNTYYLRIVYKTGMVAWSSPIWVTYKPE